MGRNSEKITKTNWPPGYLLRLVHRVWLALTTLDTYHPGKNPLLIIGFLWGIPIPVLGMGFALSSQGIPLSFSAVIQEWQAKPLHFFLLMHPLLFMFIFAVVGTLRRNYQDYVNRMLLILGQQSITDPLTRLFNHGYFQGRLRNECERALRENQPVSVLLADIDNFKAVNDNCGHPAGDLVLKKIADTIRSCCRVYDIPTRYGGEEFGIILPDTPLPEAEAIANRIVAAVRDISVPFPIKHITLSVGVASFSEDGQSAGDLLEAVDQCLYQAKRAGKNQAVCTRQISTSTNDSTSYVWEKRSKRKMSFEDAHPEIGLWNSIQSKGTTSES